MWFGPPIQKSWLVCDGTVYLAPARMAPKILNDYADMLQRCESQYALAPQCPVVTVSIFFI